MSKNTKKRQALGYLGLILPSTFTD